MSTKNPVITLRLTLATDGRKFPAEVVAAALKTELEDISIYVEDEDDDNKSADYDIAQIEDLTQY